MASLGGQTNQRGQSESFGITPVPEEDPLRSIEFRYADFFSDILLISLRKLFIRGLDFNTTVEDLKSVFGEYGEIEECVIPTDRGSGKSK